MGNRNYVKAHAKSGVDNTRWDISPRKAGIVTPYNLDASSLFPQTAALYYYSTNPEYQPSIYTLCIVGSASKTLVVNNIRLSIKGFFDSFYAAPNNKVTTCSIAITKANFTGSSATTGNWADSAIVKADSADASASGTIRVSPTGLTNEKVLFTSYHKCELHSVANASSYFNPVINIQLGRENGKGIQISGSTQILMFPITIVSGSINDLLGSISVSWYEI